MLNQIKQSLLDRCELGSGVTASLRDAIAEYKPDDFAELAILAHRIDACNDEANHWLAEDLHNDDGELYDGGGKFWSCGSKLCPSCLAKQARRNRRRAREAVSKQKCGPGEYLHFVTFTMPTPETSLLETRSIMNRAWSLLRKRSYFKRLVAGGIKSEEFTVNRKGFHYHQHQLIKSGYISFAKLKSEWTECLQRAHAEANVPITFATSDKLAVVNVQRVKSAESAINELCKYITKSDSWSKIRSEDLLDIARIRRFPRMFEMYGSFALLDSRSVRSRASLEVSTAKGIEDVNIQAILDTQSISDGELFEPNWRGRVRRRGASEYLAELHQRITECTDIRKNQLKRKYHAASFKQIASTRPPLVPRTLAFIEQIASTKKRSHIGVLIKLDSGEFRYEHEDGSVEWLDAKRDAIRLNTLAMQALAGRSRVEARQASTHQARVD